LLIKPDTLQNCPHKISVKNIIAKAKSAALAFANAFTPAFAPAVV